MFMKHSFSNCSYYSKHILGTHSFCFFEPINVIHMLKHERYFPLKKLTYLFYCWINKQKEPFG